jgi:hypothetical protein
MRHAVVIEKAACNYGAYLPDVPGRIAEIEDYMTAKYRP